MSARRARGAGVALAISALLLAGCGGGPDRAPTAASPAQAAYRDRVERLCGEWALGVTRTSQRFEATASRAGAGGALAATAARYRSLAAGLERLAARVRALPAPADEAGSLGRWLAATTDRAGDERRLARALEDEPVDAAVVERLKQRLGADTDAADAAITRFGAARCAPRSNLEQRGVGSG